MIGLITSIEQKTSKNGKKFYALSIDDGVGGSRYTAWADDVGELTVQSDDVVDFTYMENGGFKNIKSLKVADQATVAKTKAKLQSSSEDRETRIQRQSCLKAAVDFMQGKSAKVSDLIEVSEQFLLYVQYGPEVVLAGVSQPTSPTPKPPAKVRKPVEVTDAPKVGQPIGDDDIPF